MAATYPTYHDSNQGASWSARRPGSRISDWDVHLLGHRPTPPAGTDQFRLNALRISFAGNGRSDTTTVVIRRTIFHAVVLLAVVSTLRSAESRHWPQFRGPGSRGVAEGEGFPSE